jgi:arabinofuranan 3-O-arabinosyltransferase
MVIAVGLQRLGEIVFLTRLDRVLDPARMAARDFDFWNQYWDMGIPQFQTVGYWIPFDVVFSIGNALGVPPWITERLFVAAVMVGALWGFVRLADALPIGRPVFRLLGGVAYVFAPVILTRVAWQSPFAMGAALLPWVLLPLVNGSRAGSPRRAAARSGVAVMLIGGANAAITFAVLPVPLLYLLTRQRGRRRASLLRWWGLCVLMATLWWLVGLYFYARYAPDVLAYTEQVEDTVRFTPLFEVLRGTADWVMRLTGIDPAGTFFSSAGAAALSTATVAALGFAGLSRRSFPERTFVVLTLIAGVAAVGGGFGGVFGNPASDAYTTLLDGPLNAFRNVFKFQPLIAFPLTLGVVHALTGLADALEARSTAREPARVWRTAVAVTGAGAILCVGYPLFDNQITRGPGFEEIPAAWNEANQYLDDAASGRVLIVPGLPDAEFDWGFTSQLPVQWGSNVKWAVRSQAPLGGVENVHYLDAIELAIERGGTPGLVDYLRRGGFSHVLLPADQAVELSGAPPAEMVSKALLASGLERAARFGPGGYGFGDLHQLEVFVVPDPELVTVYPETSATWLSGDIESTLHAPADVFGERPYLLTYESNTGGLFPDEWLVTDGNQAYSINYGFSRNNRSYVHGSGLPPFEALDLGAGRDIADRTTQELDGVESVTASSVGPGVFVLNSPSSQPANAVDGDLLTSWEPRRFDIEGENMWGPDDPWWEIRFDSNRRLGDLDIALRLGAYHRDAPISATVATARGSVKVELEPTEEPQPLAAPNGETDFVRITFDRSSYFRVGDLIGVRELLLTGPAPVRRLAVPDQLDNVFSEPDAEDPAWLFTRTRASDRPLVALSSESQIRRTFTVPKPGRFTLAASAGAEWSLPLLLFLGTSESLTVAADTTWGMSPAVGARHLVDDDPGTIWRSARSISELDPAAQIALSWDESKRIDEFTLHWTDDSAVPLAVMVQSGSQRRWSEVDDDGSVSFPAVSGTELLITVEYEHVPDGSAPIQFTALDVPALAALYPGPIDPSEPHRVSCADGPRVLVGGEIRRFAIDTTFSTLLDESRIPLTACAPETVDLDAGTTTLDARSGRSLFTIEQVAMGNGPTLGPPGATVVDGIVEVWTAAERRIRLPDGDASILVVNELFNRGWEASVDGERLVPLRVDGWRQAFRVPAGDDRVVDVVYGPNRMFRIGTSIGLATIVGLLAMALWAGRERDSPSAVAAGKVWPPLLITIILVGAVWTTGLAALLLPILWLLRRFAPAALPWVALAGLTIAGALVARVGIPSITAQPRPDVAYLADALAAVSLLAALAAALPNSPAQSRPGTSTSNSDR